jgi:hypothetical protein
MLYVGRALAVLACALAAPLALAGGDAKPAAATPASTIALSAPRTFAAAVEAVERATGAKGEKLQLGNVPLEKGRSFRVDAKTSERLLAGSHASFRKAGFYLFRQERSYGIAGDKDHLALLATRDRNEVIRRVGTSAPRQKLTTESLIAWLDALSKDEPFELAEVGVDYIAGTFERSPKDPLALAKRCVEIAPELVGGRTASIDLLAAEIRDNRTLYLIW